MFRRKCNNKCNNFCKEKICYEINKNIKLGLALGGGGARGFAHLGVLKAFDENGISIPFPQLDVHFDK